MGIRGEARFRVRNAHQIQQLQGALARGAGLHALVHEQYFVDLLFHHVQRVQRHHGFLKDHGDLIAAHGAKLRVGGADQLLTLEADGACAGMLRHRVGQKLQNGQGGDGFARSAFTDKRHCLAFLDAQG